MLKALWQNNRPLVIVAGVIIILGLIATYQWGYINGKKS